MSVSLILEYAMYGVVFLVMISILVAAHELGHYLFARMFNMGVEEFAIGFGKRRVLTWGHRSYMLPIKPGEDWERTGTSATTGDAASFAASLEGSGRDFQSERVDTPDGPMLKETTDFTIRPWPLGGFVRIKGMLPEEDGSETKITGGFYSKPPWQRFLVLLAGPLFSVLAGILVLIPVFMFDGKNVDVNKPILGSMVMERAGYKAGLRSNDRIVSIDGQPVATFYEMTQIVRNSGGKELLFLVDRAGKELPVKVKPELDPEPSYVFNPDLSPSDVKSKGYKIGATWKTERVPLPFGAAVAESMGMPVKAVEGVLKLFRHPQNFKDNVGGPATMVSATAAAVKMGIWQVFTLSALLSISVGIMNLLPAPPLDGGQMVMSVVEMLRGGRRLSIRAQAIAATVGFTFVAALMLSVFVVDYQRFFAPKERPTMTLSK